MHFSKTALSRYLQPLSPFAEEVLSKNDNRSKTACLRPSGRPATVKIASRSYAAGTAALILQG